MTVQFRFATKFDMLLMGVGSVCACATGLSWSLLMIFFGDMVDTFVAFGGQVQT